MSCLRRDLLVNFLVLPPSVNSSRMFVGAGSAPMLQAASAWDGIASELSSAASSFSSVISGLTDQAWRGPASAAMIATAAPYAAYLSSAADQAVTAAAQAKSMASLFESALVSTVHPAAVAANRGDLVSLVTSNLLGQNGPAIAATDAAYEQMWATDVAAMVDYHAGASAALAQLTPWSLLQDVLGTLEKIPGIDVVGVGKGPADSGHRQQPGVERGQRKPGRAQPGQRKHRRPQPRQRTLLRARLRPREQRPG